jgi:mannose-6-phosphate isomerase-like protein (cupin superfamily)
MSDIKEEEDSFAARSWGTWLVLAMQPGYKVKKLTLEPGQAMSKQYHTHRDEYWVVLQGSGELYIDLEKVTNNGGNISEKLVTGSYHKIGKRVIHKAKNTGDIPLVIIETQVGDITEEGDIVRMD